jgi:hypothetical protein
MGTVAGLTVPPNTDHSFSKAASVEIPLKLLFVSRMLRMTETAPFCKRNRTLEREVG